MQPHPYYQAILDAYRKLDRPYFHQLSPEQGRAMMKATIAAAPKPGDLPELAAITDGAISGPHGSIPIRRYTPITQERGTCLYFHAGGWVIGDLDIADNFCRRLADAACCELISVDYRLAPEYPFPVPLDDAYAALQWLLKEKPGPVVLVGESAGGNLAAACSILARNEGLGPIHGQFLAYPVTDHDFTTPSYQELGSLNWLLSTKDMRFYWDQYCPSSSERDNPLVSPLRLSDVSNLPPTMLFAAELDPLRDEGLAYAQKLAGAGIPVTTRCDPGMLHGYMAAVGAIPVATEAFTEAARWIRQRLAASL